MALITAPTLDMARAGDMIGLTRAFTPARRHQDVRYWRKVLSTEQVAQDRFRVHVEGHSAVFPMTLAPQVPVVLDRGA